MKVIRPYQVSSSMVVSNSAVESHADYSSDTAYPLDAQCVVASVNRIYRCVQGPVQGKYPPDSPLYWVAEGPSNRMAMFDDQISTPTRAQGSLTVTVATGMIDSVALVGVQAYTARVTATDGLNGPVIFDSERPFAGDIPGDWYDYFFFDPAGARTLGVWQHIPPYNATHLTVTLTGVSVELGALVFGLSSDLGEVEYGASAGIVDYSRKDTSVSGVTTFARRAFSKRLSVNLYLPRSQTNRVQRTLYSLRSTPAVWVATDIDELEEASIVYGFYRDFTATISYPTSTLYSLEIEGLI